MFVNPLHRARLGSGVTLDEVTARTCLSPRIVRLIDAGQFDQLPGGLYARSYVRAFASVVGLDPDEAIHELGDRLPPDEDPFPALREHARTYLPPFVRDLTRWAASARTALAGRFAVPRLPRLGSSGQSLRIAAIGADAGILLAVYAGILRLTGWVAGVDFHTARESAGVEVAALCGLLGLLYFILFGGIGGRTPGAAIWRVPASSSASPLDMRAICVRAFSFLPDETASSSRPWETDTQNFDPANSRV